MPAPLEPLSRTLASLLRHRAADLGVHVRGDGFANVEEVLACSIIRRGMEAATQAGEFAGAKPMDVIRTVVEMSISKGNRRFELWEGDGSEVWIRATHKHSLANVAVAEPKAEAENAEAENGEADAQPKDWYTADAAAWPEETKARGEAAETAPVAAGDAEQGGAATLFAGSLPRDLDDASFRQLFESHGYIVSTKLFADKRFGFVTYEHQHEAEAAIYAVNGTEVNGSRIVVKVAEKKRVDGQARGDSSTRGSGLDRVDAGDEILVKSLPAEVTEDRLREVFGAYGTVVSLKILSMQGGKFTTAAAVMRMGTAEEASWLVDNVHGNIPVGLESPVMIRFAGPLKGGPGLSRQRISYATHTGEVASWMGSYGWITPHKRIDHPAAAKKDGRVYVHKKDLVNLAELPQGCEVEFYAYADASGLGAEEVKLREAAKPNPVAHTAPAGGAAREGTGRAPEAAQGDAAKWLELLGDDRCRKPVQAGPGGAGEQRAAVPAPAAATQPRSSPQEAVRAWPGAAAAPVREQHAPTPTATQQAAEPHASAAGAQASLAGNAARRGASAHSLPKTPRAVQGGAKVPLTRCTGQIRSFDPEKGFGFIVSAALDKDIFLPLTSIAGDRPEKLNGKPGEAPTGPLVEFDLELKPDGRPRAVNVAVTGPGAPADAPEELAAQLHAEGKENGDSNTTDEFPLPEEKRQELANLLKLLPADAPARVREYLSVLIYPPKNLSL